ncbi:hypothetical protein BXZ70DRAFT_145417 [Cristinia sonorae]|uniref:Uncharacterized protein n=1 Tax=Cristinia sonorae TaxID=1940300 RepID=A0A8K0UQJ5_9AGAR|nr:hypothetical protein BXZ70DRAFT_145417 [Cristinia sonorae]
MSNFDVAMWIVAPLAAVPSQFGSLYVAKSLQPPVIRHSRLIDLAANYIRCHRSIDGSNSPRYLRCLAHTLAIAVVLRR